MRAFVESVDDLVVELLTGHRRGEPLGVLPVEGPQRELEQVAFAAHVRAQPAEPVGVGGNLVACDGDEQQRHVVEPACELRQERERGFVRPVEVIEQDGCRSACPGFGECAAERLDERRRARVLSRHPELGQQRSEVGREGPAGLQEARRSAQAFAQDLRDRRVGLGDRGSRGTGVGGEARLLESVRDELRLADAGLSGDEHAAAEALAHRGAHRLQRGSLALPADQHAVLEHAPSVNPRRPREGLFSAGTAATGPHYGSPSHAGGASDA